MTEPPLQPDTPPAGQAVRAAEVLMAFLGQGATVLGGAAAQIASFRRAFVEQRGWLSAEAFEGLQAMAALMPGPAASQLGMAIGYRRAGWLGALAAGAGFLAPVGLIMIIFAALEPDLGSGWSHGLQVACAALVLQALIALARPLAGEPIRAGMAIGAAVGLSTVQGPVAAILALTVGAAFGFGLLRPQGEATPAEGAAAPARGAVMALGAFVLLLAALPFAAQVLSSAELGEASVFYRAGALAFGTDQALLPLMHAEAVDRSWVGPGSLVSGYGLVQALPGSSLGIAGFVGAAHGGWRSGVLGLVAVLTPGLLLTLGVAPLWERLTRRTDLRGAVAGISAVMVGLLAAALWNPVLTSAVRQPGDWALVAGAYVFLAVARLPAWLVALLFAAGVGVFGR